VRGEGVSAGPEGDFASTLSLPPEGLDELARHYAAAAKMRPAFSSEKNSAGDVMPARTRANSPIASSDCETAASSC
jgi:hypothetical protein